ncbi:MAG: hypothetical protein R3Y09_05955 [Clostridia bacterium]
MNFLRKNLIIYAPHIVWMLVLSIVYALFAELFNIYIFDNTLNSTDFYYIKGLFLVFPLAFFSISLKKSNVLWKFVLKGFICLIICGILSKCVVFTAMVAALFGLRFINNVNSDKSSFDEISHINLMFLAGFFVLTAFYDLVFLQKMIVYHVFFATLLIFAQKGLKRFEFFIDLRKDKSNLPEQRILDQAMKIFAVCTLLVILLVMPIMGNYYNFISFSFELSDETGYVYEEVESEDLGDEPVEGEDGYSLEELQDNSRMSQVLGMFWQFIEPLIYVMNFVILGWILYKGILAFLENLKKPLVVRDDVIETTFKKINEEKKSTIDISKISELLDFSPEKQIRRRYKKTLKKYNPENWQTPSEMEEMAKLEIPKLHNDYLNARYNSKD